MSTPHKHMIRIVLIDDHLVVRAGLRMVIESQPMLQVVAEARNHQEALEAVSTHKPDIILLDLDLDGENGLDFIPEILSITPLSQILVLTGIRDVELHRQAVLRGAIGVVLKDKAVETVIKAIEKIYAGEIWLDRTLVADVLRVRRINDVARENPEAEKLASLTTREHDIIRLLGQGQKNRDIAKQLHISEATVRHHLTSIFEKLEVGDRFELVVYAYRHGLASPQKD